MKLSQLLKNIFVQEIIGESNKQISYLSQDTREEFFENTLYFAVPGTQVDGHDFIEQAIQKKATTIICERKPSVIHRDVTYVVVESVLQIMGQIVSKFYGNPSEKIKVIAVTGTNGKTTVVMGLYQALVALGRKAAVFSTAGDFLNGQNFETHKKASSSMELIELHKNLKKLVDQGCEYVSIEATSHALDQYRLNGVQILGAVYTNLTQDHLDYHPNFNHYLKSKKRLFDSLSKESFAIINRDDKHSTQMVEDTKATVITYGQGDTYRDDTISFDIEQTLLTGTKISLNGDICTVPLVGLFNIYNIAAIYGVLQKEGFSVNQILQALGSVTGALGRMQIVTGEKEGVVGIVDYAHTPDAILNVLETLQRIPHERIITVIGAGGDRDSGKRPKMAHIAQSKSHYTILTSDNPRTENPKDILNDMYSGCNQNLGNVEIIEDRELAIKRACSIAKSSDIILVAGKGHEDYQIIGTTKLFFSDVLVLQKYL